MRGPLRRLLSRAREEREVRLEKDESVGMPLMELWLKLRREREEEEEKEEEESSTSEKVCLCFHPFNIPVILEF